MKAIRSVIGKNPDRRSGDNVNYMNNRRDLYPGPTFRSGGRRRLTANEEIQRQHSIYDETNERQLYGLADLFKRSTGKEYKKMNEYDYDDDY